jgi:hypothetical protein
MQTDLTPILESHSESVVKYLGVEGIWAKFGIKSLRIVITQEQLLKPLFILLIKILLLFSRDMAMEDLLNYIITAKYVAYCTVHSFDKD